VRRQRGFSLIELLIVVAIILVIAAMAIPNFLRSKMSANEASAVSSLRTINTAQTTYALTYPTVGYSDQLTKLAFPASGTAPSENAAGLLDWVLGCTTQPCEKSGYRFSINNAVGNPVNAYTINAVPSMPGQTGIRGFCSDQVPNMAYDQSGGMACTQILQ
jgi:type IV pilus assembly protein PilA